MRNEFPYAEWCGRMSVHLHRLIDRRPNATSEARECLEEYERIFAAHRLSIHPEHVDAVVQLPDVMSKLTAGSGLERVFPPVKP